MKTRDEVCTIRLRHREDHELITLKRSMERGDWSKFVRKALYAALNQQKPVPPQVAEPANQPVEPNVRTTQIRTGMQEPISWSNFPTEPTVVAPRADVLSAKLRKTLGRGT